MHGKPRMHEIVKHCKYACITIQYLSFLDAPAVLLKLSGAHNPVTWFNCDPAVICECNLRRRTFLCSPQMKHFIDVIKKSIMPTGFCWEEFFLKATT